MTGKQREPLWAGSLAEPQEDRRPRHEDVTVHVERDAPEVRTPPVA